MRLRFAAFSDSEFSGFYVASNCHAFGLPTEHDHVVLTQLARFQSTSCWTKYAHSRL
jgi:hypothetical protein